MISNKSLIVGSMLFASLTAAADVITPAEALARLRTSSDAPARVAARARLASPTPLRTVEADGMPALYLFTGDGAVTVLTADSDTPALAGFTDSYDPEEGIPPAMEYLLQYYAAQIADLRAGRTITTDDIVSDDFTHIDPICQTRWDQGSPYNADCPTLDDRRCLTGCVATAMAQVLKVHEYPEKCSGGTFTYSWYAGNRDLSLNFDNITLDWSSMKDSYSGSESAPAVAALMKAVGYAAEMEYSLSSSAATGIRMAAGLVRNFGYDCTLNYEHREWYTMRQWQELIYSELAQGRPVYYDGASADFRYGHAFVVDGYQGDGLFHLNWGWSGMSNGYFRLSALEPGAQGAGGSSAGYDAAQGAIIGMKRAETDPTNAPLHFYLSDSSFDAVPFSASLGRDVSFDAAIVNNGPLSSKTFQMACKIVSVADGKATYSRYGGYQSDTPVLSGLSAWICHIPSDLADGNYRIYPAVYSVNNSSYYDVAIPASGNGYTDAEVEDGQIYFFNRKPGQVTVTDVKVDDEVYPSTLFNFSAAVVNESDDNYYGPVTLRLFRAPGALSDFLQPIGAFVVDLAPGDTTYINLPFTFPDVKEYGDYIITLSDMNSNDVCEKIPVKLVTRPANGTPKCTAINILSTDRNNFRVELELTCNSGLYTNLAFAVITDLSGNMKTHLDSPRAVLVREGETTKVTIGGAYPDGELNKTYRLYPYYVNSNGVAAKMPSSKTTTFKFTDGESSIDDIETDGADAEYFDLSGRRIMRPANGIFIRRQGSTVSKVSL